MSIPDWLKNVLEGVGGGAGATGISYIAKAARDKRRNRPRKASQGTINRKTGKVKMEKNKPWWKRIL
jgi:hypothetical protein